ncbi:MAG: RGCVC family protein [Labedaea sp.]
MLSTNRPYTIDTCVIAAWRRRVRCRYRDPSSANVALASPRTFFSGAAGASIRPHEPAHGPRLSRVAMRVHKGPTGSRSGMSSIDSTFDTLSHVPDGEAVTGCAVCPHPWIGHDQIAARYCTATVAGKFNRACVCSASPELPETPGSTGKTAG